SETSLLTLSHSIVETDSPLDFLKGQPLSSDHAYLDADKLQLPLRQRPWQQGDRFRPFGMRGSRLVSDFLTDLKLNRFQKERQQVLLSGDQIVWVVGFRTDDRFRVTASTRRIYCIRLEN
ncbi:MAG: tRNA lysidine(34) synthetase TilS, partial [Prevotella sp.]|nr:tRNA lysidine(34) synthetase TilS [Prevotella sp.]